MGRDGDSGCSFRLGVRQGLFEEVTFAQKLEGNEGKRADGNSKGRLRGTNRLGVFTEHRRGRSGRSGASFRKTAGLQPHPGEAGRRLPGGGSPGLRQCSEQTGGRVPSLPACQPTPSLA